MIAPVATHIAVDSVVPKTAWFRANRCYDVPDVPGIYAWYYCPDTSSFHASALAGVFAKLVEPPASVSVRARARYGVTYASESPMAVRYGTGDTTLEDVLREAIGSAGAPFLRHLPKWLVPEFARPVYIGITRHLRERVYHQHFEPLVEYWEDSSQVSRFLSREPNATVQRVMNALGLRHSFALDARVRGLGWSDLRVHTLFLPEGSVPAGGAMSSVTESDDLLRPVEQLLQILADPICGRR